MGTDSSAVLSVMGNQQAHRCFERTLPLLRQRKGRKGPRQIRLLPLLLGTKDHHQLLLYPQMSRQIHRSTHETLPRQSMEILSTITPLMCLPLLSVCLSIEAVEERYKTMQIKFLPFINTQ